MTVVRIRLGVALAVGYCGLPGCAPRQPVPPPSAATAPVISDEIPEIEFRQSLYPVSVGVHQAERPPALTDDLPTFDPPELTEEEREILEAGEPRGRKVDFLALYPGKTPENRGVERAGPVTGLLYESTIKYGNQAFDNTKVYVYGQMGPVVGTGIRSGVAGHLPVPRESPAHVYGNEEVAVGEIPAEQRYGHHRDVERD